MNRALILAFSAFSVCGASAARAQSVPNLPTFAALPSASSVPLSQVQAVPGVALGGDGLALPAAATQTTADGFRLWTAAGAFSTRIGAEGGSPGSRTRGGALTFGLEKQITPELIVGVSISPGTSDTKSSASTTRADTLTGAVYGALRAPSGLEADAAFGFGGARLDSTHLVDTGTDLVTTRGRAHASLWSMSTSAGWRFRFPLATGIASIKPFVAVTASSQTRDSYTEFGADAVSLLFPSRTTSQVTGYAGAAFALDLHGPGDWLMRPELRVAYANDFVHPSLDTLAYAGATPLTLRDADPGRAGTVIDANVSMWRANGVILDAGYAVEQRRNATSQVVHAGVRVLW